MKHAQEIFARADGEVEHASAGAPFVVEEGGRLVQVGATEQYEIKFTESDGPSLPVVFKRHSCSELTYVHSVGKDMAMKKGRDQLVRIPASYLAVARCRGAFAPSTRVVSRNDGGGWFFFRFRVDSDRVGGGSREDR